MLMNCSGFKNINVFFFLNSYVSTMVPVKTMKEYDLTQEITILFSETVQRYQTVPSHYRLSNSSDL